MITILVGKTCSGKSSIQKQLIDESWSQLKVVTTRPQRKEEAVASDYIFCNEKEFKRDIQNDKFIEYRTYDVLVNGKSQMWYYGTPKYQLNPDGDYICVSDLAGAESIVRYYGKKECFVVYLDVSDKERHSRAQSRSNYDNAEWNRRLADDDCKYTAAKIKEVANFAYNAQFSSIEEAACDITDALDAYKRALPEYADDSHVIVVGTLTGGITEPAEMSYKTYAIDSSEDRSNVFKDALELIYT